MSGRKLVTVLVVAALVVLVGVALWQTAREDAGLAAFTARPTAVMGTDSTLVAVVPRGAAGEAATALKAAEAELRRVEALMSTWIEASELSRFNRGEADVVLPLSAETLAVLEAAREHHAATGGAFDVTTKPLIEAWREAAESDRLPDPDVLARAREQSRWEHIELEASGARKARESARVDLGGIAKGYGIDRAIEVLQERGCVGGLVEVGGDLRVFGSPPGREAWKVELRHPVEDRPWRELRVTDAAVCTSGDYARFVEIAGRRFSHIVDPRTGEPVDLSPSVTVVAPTALTADAWATALSVLGPPGTKRLPAGAEALVITREDGALALHPSAGWGVFEVN
jgi:thiamine biosynthesis lipoprotein